MVTVQPLTADQISVLAEETGKLVYNVNDRLLYYCDLYGYRPLISFKTNLGAGINTQYPQTAFDINSTTGACLRLIYNNNTGTATTYADCSVSSVGNLVFTAAGSSPGFTFTGGNISGTLASGSQPNITSLGSLTTLTATTINSTTLNATTIGSSGVLNLSPTGSSVSLASNKDLVLSGTGSISGVSSLTATNIYGAIMTGSQPNITSLGALTTLNATNINVDTLNVTTLNAITTNTISTNIIVETINSYGVLNLSPVGSSVSLASNKDLILSGTGSISGVSSLTATSIYGSILTASQPNITSLGTLTTLTSTTINSTTVNATTIGSAGILNLSPTGSSVSLASNKDLILAGTGSISGVNTLTATSINGTLLTASQPNITSIGTLTTLTTTTLNSTTINSSDVLNLSPTGLSVTIANNKNLVLSGTGSISGVNTLTTTTLNLSGILTSNNTTPTTLNNNGALVISGGIGISNTTDAVSSTNGGTFTSAGGGAFAKSLFVGTALTTSIINLDGIITSTNATATTLNNNGALKLAGGIGISNTTDAVSSTNGGTFTSAGGGAFAKALFVGTNITLAGTLSGVTTLGLSGVVTSTNTTATTANTNGAIVLAGGIGISNTTDAINTTNGGTFTSAGGGAFAKSLFVGNNITLAGTLSGITTLSLSGILTSANTTVTTLNNNGALVLSGGIGISNATDAISSTNGGTFTSAGGGAFAKSLFVGNNITLAGTLSGITTLGLSGVATSTNTTATTLNSNGALVLAGGIGISNSTDAVSNTNGGTFTSAGGGAFAKSLFVGTALTTSIINLSGIATSSNTTATTLNSNGALVLAGGIGISNATDAISSTNGGTFTSAGGGAFAKALFVGTNITLAGTLSGVTTLGLSGVVTSTNTTSTTLNSNGALVLAGGIGISNNTDAVSSTNGGTFTSAGGGAFAKSLFVGNNLTVAGNLNIFGTTTTLNTTNISISDNILELHSGPTGAGLDSGIVIQRFQNNNLLGSGDVVGDTAELVFTLVYATNNSITLPNTASSVNEYYNGWWIKINSGAGINQVRKILTYDGTTRIATIDNVFSAIPSTDVVNLYNKEHASFLWQETSRKFVFGFAVKNPTLNTHTFTDYADIVVNNCTLQSTDISTSNLTGSIISSGGIGISNTTDAVSSTNGGTFTSAGGGAFAKSLFVGTALSAVTLNLSGIMTSTNDTVTTLNSNGALVLSGGIGISNTTDAVSSTNGGTFTSAGGGAFAKSLFVGTALSAVTLNLSGIMTSTNNTASTSNILGALKLAGGIGISNTTDAVSSTSGGTFTSAGGGAFAKSLFVGTNITLDGTLSGVTTLGLSGVATSTNATATTLNSNGALVLAGGIGISNTTDAVSSTNGGTFTSAGGGAFAKALYVGTSVNAASLILAGSASGVTTLGLSGIATSTNATPTTLNNNGALVLSGGIGISNTTDAVSSANGGTFTSAGGGAFAKALFVGTTLTATTIAGTLSTPAQTAITSVGSLTGLTTAGLTLGATAITATGTEINKLSGVTAITSEINTLAGVTAGTITANKALVVDVNNDLASLRNLSLTGDVILQTPLKAIYGGIGYNTFTKGDLLVAASSTQLNKLPVSSSDFDMLVSDSTATNGLTWGPGLLFKYFTFGTPTVTSFYTYTLPFYNGRNKLNTGNLIIPSNTINLNTTGLNGIAISSNLTGTLYPNPTTTTIVGTGTTILTDLIASDIITIAGQSRKVVSIISDTSLTVDTPFTVLNLWNLSGAASLSATQKKFGNVSLTSTTTTGFGNLQLGSSYGFNATANTWTYECFVYINAINANLTISSSSTAFSFLLSYRTTGNLLALSLGQGSSFNIANLTTITGAIAAATWYHIAIVYNGTNYKVYNNGVLALTISNSTKITSTTFNNIRFGGDGTTAFNGFIDEFRLSNIERYTAAFTPTTSQFTLDANTISLNHFEESTIGLSDETIANVQFNYNRGGKYYSSAMLYVYAINNSTTPGYILSTRSSETLLVDLPSGYTNTDCRKTPLFLPIQSSGIPNPVFLNFNLASFGVPPRIVTNSTSTTLTTYQLSNYIPNNSTGVLILLTHVHVGAISCGITIGFPNAGYQTYLTTATAGTQSITISVPVSDANTFDAHLTAVSSTTSFSIVIITSGIDNTVL